MVRPQLSGFALVFVWACQVDPVYLGPVDIKQSHRTVTDAGLSANDGAPAADAAMTDATLSDAQASDAAVDGGAHAVCVLPTDAGAPTALPMIVDQYFVPSGYAGDAAQGALSAQPQCALMRQPGAQGNCYTFSYTPVSSTVPGGASWAGLFFQYPVSNWGGQPGRWIEPGATRVTFLAAGAQGGEIVTFRAGGVRDPAGNLGCADDFTREMTVRLTTDFQRYELNLQGASYTRVISAFSWKISRVLFSGQTPQPISFSLDDIRWE